MITLTKTELRWMFNMVVKRRENSKGIMCHPDLQYLAFHKLEHENMSSLAEKLERVIGSDSKRIAVRGF
ncbi:MAG: hypothetical protein FWC16_00660 [Defluviitaleaceae bacterium]|nr:hypothetical protein [Defluviitaleaceae bacterium]MCL2273415.1 hypothetical protein [Defluviitaleaceae bacterium]